MTTKPSFGVLDDVKVVYSAMEIAAPTAAAIMGEWGADVTWIENHWNGDSMRDTTWVKEMERRNMRSISMNQFSDEGKEVLFRLIKDADIFIESSKGPVFARKGITDEELWKVNPRLVIVHVSGFGQSGDSTRINTAAYDLTVAAYAGMVAQNGSEEQPVGMHPYTGDYINSLMIISSALAALHKAKMTGQGESIDLAMHETLLRVGTYYMMDYLNAGVKYPRQEGVTKICVASVSISVLMDLLPFVSTVFLRISICSSLLAWDTCGVLKRFQKAHLPCGNRILTLT